MRNKITGFLFAFVALILLFNFKAYAAATDEITNYEIKVDVNDDASLTINYHIDWLVLDSDSAGPLEWVKVGIPNSHSSNLEALSDNISSISTMNSGGYYARIDFDRNYYEGEVASFDFKVDMDYMYQVNKLEEGQTVYDFTPGWFEDIAVDKLVVSWNMDKAVAFSPQCIIEDGYFTWEDSLAPGGRYPITVTYPNDAFDFDLSYEETESSSSTYDDITDFFAGLICFVISLAFPLLFVFCIIKAIKTYNAGANFNGSTKKITRTRVKYYSSCQGCGAVRKEGEKFCTYCGRSFVESEETITEEELKKEAKDISGYSKDGEYRLAPDTYVRVHTVMVPRPVTTSRSSGGHSSCAHSSCACACACACAGGGRAGCSTKDFYRTDLKLRQIKKGCSK